MADVTIKNARKRSEDPIQEALRTHKSDWNKNVSLLIAQLIAFKRGLNGRGEPRVGLPPSNIKNPVPSEVGQYLDQLVSRYDDVVSDARRIIDEQAHYAGNRRKSTKEQAELGIVSELETELVKLGSWWGSRAWNYVKNYGSSQYWYFHDQDIRDRMGMLRVSADIIELLEDIEDDLVSKDEESIYKAVYNFLKLVEIFNKLLMPKMGSMVVRHVKHDKQDKSEQSNQQERVVKPRQEESNEESSVSVSPNAEQSSQPLAQLSGEIGDYTEEKRKEVNKKEEPVTSLNTDVDVDKVIEIQRDMLDAVELIGVMNLMNVSPSIITKSKSSLRKTKALAESIKVKYRAGKLIHSPDEKVELQKLYLELLSLYSEFVNDSAAVLKFDPKETWSFASLVDKVKEKIKIKADSIENEFISKLAHNMLSRWLKRQKMKVFPNTTEQLRIESVYKILSVIKSIDIFQDTLENNEASISNLSDSIKLISTNCAELANDLFSLAKIYNADYEYDRAEGKVSRRLITETNVNRIGRSVSYFQGIANQMGSDAG